jgi:hypothetical protein
VSNGDDVWSVINEMRRDVKSIAVEGCAHKGAHKEFIRSVQNDIKYERGERQAMGDRLEQKMNAVRNQILIGMLAIMALTLVIDKVLK